MSEANGNNDINDTEGKETNNQEETNESSNSNTKESTKQKVIKKRNMTSIQMLNENEKFNIVEEANNLFRTTVPQTFS